MNSPIKKGFIVFNKLNSVALLTLVFGFLSFCIHAQIRSKIDYYSTEEGLSHDGVASIIKDDEGFIWVGTWNGINRFDGQNFRSFKSSPGDRSVLTNNRIDQIVAGYGYNLWVHAYDNKVYRFDKKTESFHPFQLQSTQGSKFDVVQIQLLKNGGILLISIDHGVVIVARGDNEKNYVHLSKQAATALQLPSNVINFCYQDQGGRVWIGTAKGLVALQHNGSNYARVKLDPRFFNRKNFTAITEDANGIYLSTDRGDIISLKNKGNVMTLTKAGNVTMTKLLASKNTSTLFAITAEGTLVSMDKDFKNFQHLKYDGEEKLGSIFEDRKGVIWIEPEKTGVIRYNPKKKTFEKFHAKNPGPTSFKGNHFKIFEDRKGNVWVNMKGGGLGVFDGKQIVEFQNALGRSDRTISSTIATLYYDSNDVLWFTGLNRGLYKAILLDNHFTLHTLNDKESDDAESDARAVLHDDMGRLWIGSKNEKIYVQKNGTDLSVEFSGIPKGGIGQVYCMLEDRDKNIWMGTKDQGLYIARPTNLSRTKYMLQSFKKNGQLKDGISSNHIYALLEDKLGKIYIGTFDDGLNIAIHDGKNVRFIHRNNGLVDYPKEGYGKIRHMLQDVKGNIWIGTTGGLVLKKSDPLDVFSQPFVVYSKVPGHPQSLGNNDVQYILKDSKNRIWLGTSGGGLSLALSSDPFKSIVFKNYGITLGMPSNYVLSMAEANDGQLWAATQNGLTRFNPSTERFKNYNSYDGLPVATFSEAAAENINGKLFFGTTRGYLSFDPALIAKRAVGASIVFTNLQINNEDQYTGSHRLLNADINYVKALTLKHNANTVSIAYTVLDGSSGPKIPFAFRLRGFEKDWKNDNDQRRATYTNLPPGKFVFEVKYLNSNEYKKELYKSLTIEILPPFWKTWWAYLIYVVVFLALGEVVRKTLITMWRLKQKIAVEQKLAQLKADFLTSVSHELRTPLTLILSPIEYLGINERLSDEGNVQIAIVKRNAHRMIRFINQLLDLHKLEAGKTTMRISQFEISEFLNTIMAYFQETARQRHIKIQLCSAVGDLMVWGDIDKLDVVFYNLLSNALKFSPDHSAITITVTPNLRSGHLRIEVYDQGEGVDESKLEDIFSLYYQVEKRHMDVTGSGIGLALSKELVVLHKGQIKAENNGCGGLTVIVDIPLGNDHFEKSDIEYTSGATSDQNHILKDEAVSSTEIKELGINKHLVLLVEDNKDLRTFLALQLQKIYRVETAADGNEGWEKASTLIPDLILSDVMMPGLNGIELLDKLKKEVITSHIPVILLSAKHAVAQQIEGLEYGADYYITKPFNNQFLLSVIAGLIKGRELLFSSLMVKKDYPIKTDHAPIITEKDKAFLENVIEIVEKGMLDSQFNIDSVAENICMGRSTFYRKFKSLTNQTPVEFVRDMRLTLALRYLDEGEMTMLEIAYSVGFSNAKYFSTCFREKYNQSPSEYLKYKKTLS